SNFMCFASYTTPTPPPYALSLHDALPILPHGGARDRHGLRDRHRASRSHPRAARKRCVARSRLGSAAALRAVQRTVCDRRDGDADRKSTRLNSSHDQISYAVFCLKKKKKI